MSKIQVSQSLPGKQQRYYSSIFCISFTKIELFHISTSTFHQIFQGLTPKIKPKPLYFIKTLLFHKFQFPLYIKILIFTAKIQILASKTPKTPHKTWFQKAEFTADFQQQNTKPQKSWEIRQQLTWSHWEGWTSTYQLRERGEGLGRICGNEGHNKTTDLCMGRSGPHIDIQTGNFYF